ncbi:Ig-like domain-containing protein [Massilia sp. erpn]|uniref:Ig-like domain-containing protein n=1 Tax=Massilia sp. erpn TaxID=2738142 RepID=UPI002106FB12|nr:Ig-like domain-containing protein [Massilia sp. erpn]UTY58528.1 DUF4214 domain-containing protein [Massilia sp. erpn]
MLSATYDFASNVTAHTVFDSGGVKVASQTVSGHVLTMTASTGSVVVADEQDFAGTDVTELVGQIFAVDPNDVNGPLSLTLSLDSGKTFDLSSIAIFDWADSINQLRLTTSKGTVVININSSVGTAETFALNDPKLKGISSVVLTDQAGNPIFVGLDNIVLDNITLPNATPTFVGATTTLTLAQNAGATDIRALLHVSDSDNGQTETWSQSSAPSHGTLSFSGATASSGSTDITPGGTITYTPTAGFAGTDSFVVQVTDGSATSTRTITVSVTPATPGAPDLATASDTGSSSTDNITGATSLSFSGSSAAGDSSSTVRVFLDKNNNGSYDAGTDATATATVSNGSWTVSGLSTSGYSDGSYNAYAIVTSATGALNSTASSALSVTLDHTGPATTIGSLALSADSGSSGSDFITNTAAQTVSATLSAGLAAGEVAQASLDNGATWTNVSSMVSGTTLSWTGVTLSGSSTLKLRVIDEHGNAGTAASQAYVLDTTAPATTSATTAFSADTGSNSSDLITATAAQTLSGTLSANVQAGELVEISLDNGSTWSTASSTVGQSSWSLAGQVLSGSGTLKVRVSDAAGNHGSASSQAYVLDTAAPTAAAPVRANLVTPTGSAFTFTVTYADSGGAGIDASTFGTGNVTVKDSGNNALTVSGISASGNTVTYTVTAPGGSWDGGDAGSYTIGIAGNSVKDLAGNAVAANASAHSFNVLFSTAPAVSALGLSADSGSSASDFITNIAAQTISATLGAVLPGGAVVKGSLDNGATWTDITAMVSGTSVQWTGVTLSGSGTIIIKAVDSNNLDGAVATQAYTLDTTAPATLNSSSSFSADTGSSSTDLITATAAQSLGGILGAAVQAGEVVEVSLDNGATWATASSTVGQTSWSLAGQTLSGSGTLKVRVSDAAGNHGSASSQAYVLDTTAPTAGTPVRADMHVPSGSSFTFTVTYADSGGAGIDTSTFGTGNVTVKDSGNNALTVSGVSASGNTVTYTVTAPGGSWDSGDVGSYTIGIAGNSVKDLAGNAVAANASAHTFNVTPNSLPQLGGTFSTALSVNDNSTATPFSGVTVSDADGDAISIAISYAAANGVLSGTGLSGTAGNYLLTAASAAAAQSALQALVFTPTANQVAFGSTTSTAFTLTPNDGNANGMADSSTLVTAAPVRPTATLALSDSALTAGETAVLTVTFSEAVTGFTSADLTIPNGTLGTLSSSDGGRTWTATYTPPTNTTSATNAFTLDLTGVQDAGGSSGLGTASTANFTLNTVPPSEPPPTGTIDGVPVVQQQGTDPVTGLSTITLTVPLVPPTRNEDPNTPNANMADIPLSVSTGGVRAGLTVSLPTGTGLQADGPNTLLNHEQGLLDLIRRIEQKTVAGSSVQQEMTGQGTNFLNDLLSSVLLKTNTLVPTAAAGQGGNRTIMIEGSSSTPAPGGEPNKSAIGLVIDATQLGGNATLQLDNVDFAAIVGNATVRGGDGRNMVVGDGASQNIFLGADDDLLFGGAGKDVVGSAGGNDRLDGGADDDFVAGGIGDDTLIGGSGNDILQGGRSDSGQWDFYMKADGTLSARHQTAIFAPLEKETVQLAEINTGLRVMDFLAADKAALGDIALLYHAAFSRAADIGGLNFYLRGGATVAQTAKAFTDSSEWAGLGWEQLSDSAFVAKLYQQVLGRVADAQGYQFWMEALSGAHGAAASRSEVLAGFALSAEHRALQNTANGLALAQGSLAQEASWFANSGNDRLEGGAGSDVLEGGDGIDTAVYAGQLSGYQFVLARDGQVHVVDKANGDSDTLRAIEKGEFAGQQTDLAFTQAGQARLQTLGLLYEAVLDRPGDLAGFAWWASLPLDAAQYAAGFAMSAEFQARYDGVGNSALVQALYANSGLAESAAGGAAAWVAYLDTHSRAELIGSWIGQQAVIEAQYASQGLWLI